MTHIDSTFTSRKNTIAMSKNAIHNFNLSIKNSADIKSSENLTEAILKELAKVSKEMSQQKDIVQIWQEQQTLNATAIANNSSTSIEEGAIDTIAEKNGKQLVSVSNTSSISEGTMPNHIVSAGEGANSTLKQVGNTSSVLETTTSNSSASIGEGVADTTGSTILSSAASVNTTSPTLGAGNSVLNFSNSTTTQTYGNVADQQTLAVPQMLQTNSGEPTRETVIAEIEKKLTQAIKEKDFAAIAYWTSISKAFGEEAKVQDFDGKPNNALFTDMYAMLKQSNQIPITSQNFNWDDVRKKMVESIDNNILKGKISQAGKNRWKLIKEQLKNEAVNVANLFERYNELFLLLKEVEGLDKLPGTITITTKTKIYPNLSADRLYAEIGKENVYVFLKEINNKEITGRAVRKGAVKIKNTDATKFIVGESLEFILDEALIKQHNEYKKEDINWIVYKENKKKKNKDQEFIFINEGTSFSYNFDAPGKYKVEAYGGNPGSNSKDKEAVKLSAFVEVEVIAQEIIIVSPATIKTTFVRPFTEEQSFKVTLKNPEVKTLNPLKLYYQIAYINADKVTTISDEQELDSTGIVKLAMPNFGEYSIKVVSKDQYTLNQKYSIKTIKNFINSIEITENKAEKDIYLWNITNQNPIFKAQNFKIEPATLQEKQNIKWLVYDKNGKIYVPDRLPLQLENNDAGKQYLVKGESFTFSIPKKEGEFTIEAYSNVKQGSKSTSSKKIFVKHPEVTEAYWTYNDGNKKNTSGFAGEINHIKASIPGYVNQAVRIKFYLNDSKVVNYHNDTATNGDGEINKILKFDASLQKHFGLKNGKTAKIRFELEGIQNGNVPYLFKENANAYKETLLNVTTSAKITDAYFMYDGNRVNPFTQVPYGAKVTGIVKTLNMVGKAVNLKIYKDVHHPKQSTKVIVDNEGVAVINFTLNKNWKEISVLSGLMDTFYIGIEGVESKISLENGLNAIVVNVKHDESKKEKLDENNPQLIWGAKVNKEFRVKVVQICKKLWPKNTLEMANGLMAVMNRETGGTFAPHQIEGKKLVPKEQLTKDSFITYDKKGNRISHAVGLVQFTQKALTDMGEYKGGGMDVLNELKLKFANMTQLEQLTKVEDYMNAVAILPTIPEEIYMAVFAPAYVGRGLDKTIYELGTTNYNENASLDVDKTKNGIQIKELIDEYYISLENGKYGRNIWRNPLDRMELRGWYSTWRLNDSKFGYTPTRDSGKHEGLDLYAPVGTPVRACVDGLIVFNSTAGGYGNTVVLKGYYESKLYFFSYSHLKNKSEFIADKSWVKAGEIIGYTGKSGNAKDLTQEKTHLHFEVRPLKEWGDKTKEFRGRVDPVKEIKDLIVDLNPKKENQI
ncbi:M23 family metallopeptidase [Flavobacterium sp. ov086]|uniref:M23 family metallopeptidase n=1 Tax=Flavobacterium sp. ov086 TaxID=1761785 RepID=UPI000B76F31E|nr:M23 family metallopeptidase [Flavobacterium sp. ov086]